MGEYDAAQAPETSGIRLRAVKLSDQSGRARENAPSVPYPDCGNQGFERQKQQQTFGELRKGKMRMLDGFAGRLGWSKAFLERGWKVTAVDLVVPPDIPDGIEFIKADMLSIHASTGGWFSILEFDDHGQELWCEKFDFACFSSPCEEFSVHGMKHFHPNPKYPSTGLKLFNHSREIAEASGIPYVMENVRAAQDFVGRAVNHVGSFYLWGNSVPPILPQGIKKGMRLGTGGIEGMNLSGSKRFRDMTPEQKRAARKTDPMLSAARKMLTASVATIPPELSSCVADYAERLIEQRSAA